MRDAVVHDVWVGRGRNVMDLNETLLSLIDELYAGAFDHTRLSTSLGRIAGLAGGSGGVMYLMNEIEHRLVYGILSNFDVDARSQVDGAHAEQVGHYHRQMAVGSVTHTHSVWPIDEMKRSWFYQEVLKKQDIMYGGGCLLLRTPTLHGMIMLNRSERVGPFSEHSLDLLRVLVPHLSRVMQITLEMNAIARERETFAAMLDVISTGVVLVDGSGKLLHMNRTAESIVSGDDGLAVKQGRLVPCVHDDDRTLVRLIGQVSSVDGQSFERGGACTINRPSGLPPYLVIVTPCSDLQARAFAPLLPACTILIRDPARRERSAAGELKQLFGLTHQESKVAIAIAEGRGIGHVADGMGLSELTVRNHLQRVFAKTNTSRQAELVRLLAALSSHAPR
jgi:DNA-binding CsgD family transcriptional regulator/PAS domain-containing protein